MPQTLSDMGFNPYSALTGQRDDEDDGMSRLEEIVKALPGKISEAEAEAERTRKQAELLIGEDPNRAPVENTTAAFEAYKEAALLGRTATTHDQRSPWWGILNSIIPGAINAGVGAFGGAIPGGNPGQGGGQGGGGDTLSGGGWTPPWVNPSVGNPFTDSSYGGL